MTDVDLDRFRPPAGVPAAAWDDAAWPAASRARRFAGLVVDWMMFYVLGFVVIVAGGVALGPPWFQFIQDVQQTDAGFPLVLAYKFMLVFSYYLVCEGLWGRTVGKLVAGTVVVSRTGGAPTRDQILRRTLARFIPFEALSFLGTAGWHDEISQTRVVRIRP